MTHRVTGEIFICNEGHVVCLDTVTPTGKSSTLEWPSVGAGAYLTFLLECQSEVRDIDIECTRSVIGQDVVYRSA